MIESVLNGFKESVSLLRVITTRQIQRDILIGGV